MNLPYGKLLYLICAGAILIAYLSNNNYSKSISNADKRNHSAQITQDSLYEDEESYEEKDITVNGKTYKLSIKRTPKGEIIDVDGYKYMDNIVEIKMEHDEQTIFRRVLRKDDFKQFIAGLEKTGTLWGAHFDHYNDLYVSIGFNIGEPDTDFYYSFMFKIYYTGCYSIEQITTIEECEL